VTPPLEPGSVIHAADVSVEHAPVSPEKVVEGAPTVGEVTFGGVAGAEIGVWECTRGTATDIEVDEVSVVISGHARSDFISPALPSIEIGSGDVFRLAQGMKTVWTVTETLRKIYVA
jgi:uncharacterized cupin superfamily protein